jgi:spiro-SPASM protein
MNDAVILIHLPLEYANGLEGHLHDALISEFTKKIISLNTPVYLSAATLETDLKKFLPQAVSLPATSEIQSVRHIFKQANVRHIGIANGIYPLLDLKQTDKLFGIHDEFRADISYAENLPPGMAFNFVSRDILESLEIMEARDEDLAQTGIRPFVEKNINQFHAEVHYEEPDYRLLRLDFSLGNRRSLEKVKAILPEIQNLNEPYPELQEILSKKPGLLHSFPSYIELELCSTTKNVSYFSPLGHLKQEPHQLSDENFRKVLEFIRSGYGDTSVCASGLGEPLEHPKVAEYLEEILDEPGIRYVFVETNGIHLDKIFSLTKHPRAAKLRVITLLNSLARFSELAGAPVASLDLIKTNLKQFAGKLAGAGLNPLEILYLQTLKVEENETEIDELFALAEDLGATFLFQKYNRYAELMPERRVSDMTPLERYSCWHLRRDLFVRANGDVAYCKQTVDQSKNSSRGNLASTTLAEAWLNQRQDFILNFQEKYPDHLPCLKCDEYFTFNF